MRTRSLTTYLADHPAAAHLVDPAAWPSLAVLPRWAALSGLAGAIGGGGLWILWQLAPLRYLLAVTLVLLLLAGPWAAYLAGRLAVYVRQEGLLPAFLSGTASPGDLLAQLVLVILYRLRLLWIGGLGLTAAMASATLLEGGQRLFTGKLPLSWLGAVSLGGLVLAGVVGLIPALAAAGAARGLEPAANPARLLVVPLVLLIVLACAGWFFYQLGFYLVLVLVVPGGGCCLPLPGILLALLPVAIWRGAIRRVGTMLEGGDAC